jgi:hypothetical protein
VSFIRRRLKWILAKLAGLSQLSIMRLAPPVVSD